MLVFFSKYDENEFIMLDLYCGPTDQNDMVEVGVRCSDEHNNIVRKLMLNIYENAYPKSNFIESKNNELLLSI